MKETLLKIDDLHVHYGGVKALDGVSVSVDEGEIVAVMGPNGAGKSTVLKAIFGIAPIEKGGVLWHEGKVAPTPMRMVKLGISFVPQGRRVFPSLTVEENLDIAEVVIGDKSELARRKHEVMETFPVLREKRNVPSGMLSGGQQQMLALARGLMTEPKILLLDEPTLGLSPKLVKEVFEKIKEIRERHNTAIVVVEHNLKSLLDVVDRGYVLDKGRVVAHGTKEELGHSSVLERVIMGSAHK